MDYYFYCEKQNSMIAQADKFSEYLKKKYFGGKLLSDEPDNVWNLLKKYRYNYQYTFDRFSENHCYGKKTLSVKRKFNLSLAMVLKPYLYLEYSKYMSINHRNKKEACNLIGKSIRPFISTVSNELNESPYLTRIINRVLIGLFVDPKFIEGACLLENNASIIQNYLTSKAVYSTMFYSLYYIR